MKNQYVGDIGDYGKYSLLRAFVRTGVSVGVNWYLTRNDGSNDGKFTEYLKNKEGYRRYDPEVFDALKKIASKKRKTVLDIQNSGILPGVVYYSTELGPVGKPSERMEHRLVWFEESMDVLKGTDLIFMDPDNGLLESNDGTKLGAEKYVLPDEVKRYFNAGHNVIYYCHKGRRTIDQWFNYKSVMFDMVPEAKSAILTYHKGTQRSYVFLIHEEDFVKCREIIDHMKQQWFQIFTEEFTNLGDTASRASER